MKNRTLGLLGTFVTGVVAQLALLSGGAVEPEPAPVRHQTLFANDPLRTTLSFDSGDWGTTISSNVHVNIDSQVSFDIYDVGALTPGIQGGQDGFILDLGTPAELAAKYGYAETVGQGQGFASIHFEGDLLMIVKDVQAGVFQPFDDGNRFLQAPPQSSTHATPKLGHVYLVKLIDTNDPTWSRVVKLLVSGHRSGESVDLTWRVLTEG